LKWITLLQIPDKKSLILAAGRFLFWLLVVLAFASLMSLFDSNASALALAEDERDLFTDRAADESAQTSAAAAVLSYVSGDSAMGLINQPLGKPLQVKVTDLYGFPVMGHSVFFVVRRGGHFNGQTTITTLTNSSGIAEATPVLGAVPGLYNNIFEAQAFAGNGGYLAGAPVRFSISAKSSYARTLRKISGDRQSGRTLAYLRAPLVVQALSSGQQPVVGQAVRFKVVKGSGLLGNAPAQQVTVYTDAAGMAAISYQLGEEIGANLQSVVVDANDGVYALENSPMTFTASAMYGQPDPAVSEIRSTSPVPADGQNASVVTVKIYDGKKNPVPDVRAYLVVDGEACSIDQPAGVSDERGEIRGAVRSTRSGAKKIHAVVGEATVLLKAETIAQFQAGPARHLAVQSGNYQYGIINSALAQPVRIRVTDAYENPVADAWVSWVALTPGGEIRPASSSRTDSRGELQATWILAGQVGTQRLLVSVAGAETIEINAQAGLPATVQLHSAQGDGQLALPNDVFSDSLHVLITNSSLAPIAGVPILFTVVQGSAVIEGSAMPKSNSLGRAGVRVVAGAALGGVRVAASVGDSVSAFFHLSVAQSVPQRLLAVHGDQRSGPVLSLIQDLKVQVLDAYDHPVAHVPVVFTCHSEGGHILSQQPVWTFDNGLALTDVRLGRTSGSYYVTASALNLQGSPVTMRLEALPGLPAQLVDYIGNRQESRPEQFLSYPLKVRVLDLQGNGVPSVPVLFAITEGNGLLGGDPLVYTDSTGTAAMFWRLGRSGPQTVQVRSDQLAGQIVEFTSRLIENEPPVILAPADTIIQETATLAFTLNAVDPEGDPWSLHLSTLPRGAVFDSVNTRLFLWTPDIDQQGRYPVSITAQDRYGAVAQKTIFITVVNVNRAPVLQVQPDTVSLSLKYYRSYDFSVAAIDPDGDSLTYDWRVNGQTISRTREARILPNPSLPARFDLNLAVSDGKDTVHHVWNLQLATAVAGHDADGRSAAPRRFHLAQNYPNPFNPETTISYELDQRQPFTMHIMNLSGQVVRTLCAGVTDAGSYQIRWDGRDDTGQPLPSGLYLCALSGESRQEFIKVMLLK